MSPDAFRGSGEIVVDLQATPIGTFLWFDGVDLMVVDVESETILRSWTAFSGRPEATAARDPADPMGQHAPSVGPIPEGLYGIATEESTSRATADSTWDWIKWTAKSRAWGIVATPVLPVGDTDTLGRSGIHVHGGAEPGSAGCLDLLDKNEEFHAFLAGNGPLDGTPGTAPLLLVDYLPTRLSTPRTHANPMFCPDVFRENPQSPEMVGCVEGGRCSREAAHRQAVLSERPVLLREICRALKA
ncbi:MAG: tlde1 domain-containing protein [Kofleriaceae bacterium]